MCCLRYLEERSQLLTNLAVAFACLEPGVVTLASSIFIHTVFGGQSAVEYSWYNTGEAFTPSHGSRLMSSDGNASEKKSRDASTSNKAIAIGTHERLIEFSQKDKDRSFESLQLLSQAFRTLNTYNGIAQSFVSYWQLGFLPHFGFSPQVSYRILRNMRRLDDRQRDFTRDYFRSTERCNNIHCLKCDRLEAELAFAWKSSLL